MAGLLCEGGGGSRGTDTNRRKQQESRTIFFMFYSTTLIVFLFLFLFLFIRNMPMKRPEMDPDLRGAHPEIGIRIYVPADPEFGESNRCWGCRLVKKTEAPKTSNMGVFVCSDRPGFYF